MLTLRLALACSLAIPALFGQSGFFLKDGDTVVFYGDSITDQRLYTTFAETYAVTRFPKRTINFVHSGWGGDRVTGGGGGPADVRLNRDVVAYKPTVMTVMLGMNDGRYRAFDQATFDTYADGMRHIVKATKSALPGIRITLIQPSPYDDVTRAGNFPGGYNAVLVKYGEFLKTLASEEKLSVADLNTPVVEELAKANSTDAENAKKLLPDRVHPGPSGHLLMAKALLKAWGAPALVTSVEIDGARGAVRKAENTTLSNVKGGPVVSWLQLDNALPMPVDQKDPLVMLAVKSSDFEQSLDQQPLKVTGLNGSSYRLTIDDDAVGTFSGKQLADGINLAMLPTPMARQASEVHALTLKHCNVHNTRWRQIQVPLEAEPAAHKLAAMAALDQLEADLVAKQRLAAQPRIREYRITAVE